jgi:hypothetical protein
MTIARRMVRGQNMAIDSCWVDGDRLSDDTGRGRKVNARAQRRRPRVMMGMERRRMRRRPMRSIAWKATTVKRKFVRAMEREVKVGERKPMREKMVAEKYMREF